MGIQFLKKKRMTGLKISTEWHSWSQCDRGAVGEQF
jgi:hypothetical protein